MSLLTIMIEL